MSSFLPVLPDEPPVLPSSWNAIWRMALTQPSAELFAQLSQAPAATTSRAHVWVFVSALVASFLAGSLSWLVGLVLNGGATVTPSPLEVLTLSPFIALVGLALFVIAVNILLLAARALGGKASYRRLAFACACALCPLGIMGGFLSAIPILSATNLIVFLYALWLTALATHAVNRLDWPRSLLALGAMLLLLAALSGCFVLAALPILVG